MSDLVPPALPGEKGQQRAGFFKKFFLKEEPKTEKIDLDDIKRKLGIDESPAASAPPAPAVSATPGPAPEPEPTIEIEDWAPPAPFKADAQEWSPEPAPPRPAPVSITSWTEDTHPEPQATPSGYADTDAPPKEAIAIPDIPSDWADETAPAEEESSEDASGPAPASDPISAPADAEMPSFDGGEHHKAVDEHFAPVQNKEDRLRALVEKHQDLPDWHLQHEPVPADKYFILRNGQPIRSLRELSGALAYIDDETLTHHVNEYRNDFSNWIKDVINDAELAEQVRAATDREGIIAALAAHRTEAAQRAEKHLKRHGKSIEQLKKGISQVDDLREQLDRKTREIAVEKKHSMKIVKTALDAEVAKRAAEERARMESSRKDLEQGKQHYYELAKEAEARLSGVEGREAALEAKRQKLEQKEQELKARMQALQEEKAQAAEMIKEAARVKRDLEQLAKQRAQVDEGLAEIGRREEELARQSTALEQRERKITEDITRLEAKKQDLVQQEAEHARRLEEIKQEEARVEPRMKDAEERERRALESERQTVARIKEETKKLDGLRTKIDRALQAAVKNKQKAMYATELRKHLEKSILQTKDVVEKEREKMEEDAFKSYLAAKEDTTPVGQPAGRSESPALVRNLDLYEKVQEARTALERSDLEKAKQLYTQLREDFSKVSDTAPERNALYAQIRELYDDIRLEMLER